MIRKLSERKAMLLEALEEHREVQEKWESFGLNDTVFPAWLKFRIECVEDELQFINDLLEDLGV